MTDPREAEARLRAWLDNDKGPDVQVYADIDALLASLDALRAGRESLLIWSQAWRDSAARTAVHSETERQVTLARISLFEDFIVQVKLKLPDARRTAMSDDDVFDALSKAGRIEKKDGRLSVKPLSPDDAMDIYVPGNWTCPKCGFCLSSQTLFVGSGDVGCTREQVMAMSGEHCPNDGEPMRRTTWRERAIENQKWGESLMEEVIAAAGAEHLPGALESIRQQRQRLADAEQALASEKKGKGKRT